jgi:hypothetical protein
MTRALAMAGAIALSCSWPMAVSAHTLDEYLQATRVSFERAQVSIEMDLTPGSNIAAAVTTLIDADRNGVVTPAEAHAYGQAVIGDLIITFDRRPLMLSLQRIEIPPLEELTAGGGAIRLRVAASQASVPAGRHEIELRNHHLPDLSVYLVNALLPADREVTVLAQRRDARQSSAVIEYQVRRGIDPGAWLLAGFAALAGLIVLRAVPAVRRPGREAIAIR